MITGKEKLKLQSDHSRLGIARAAWEVALEKAQADPVVKIRHAVVDGDTQYRTHVAAISDRVGCHFHAHGDEGYAVVRGQGTLYWGKAERTDEGYSVPHPETPVSVREGDSFTIPEGYAHQLKNDGEGDLIIVFGCPDTHLDDKADRTLLPALAP